MIFLIGSAPCGQARNMGELIAFRAIQGIGGVLIFVDSLSWRWVFCTNLPIGAIALVVIATSWGGTRQLAGWCPDQNAELEDTLATLSRASLGDDVDRHLIDELEKESRAETIG